MKCLSLFSGIGGFDLALKNLGHELVGACEIDRYARLVYEKRFPGIKIYHDATKIKPEDLPRFDILCAGFPCQAFSIAGKRLGFEESRGTLFFEIARIAKQKRPRFLLLENVKGLLSHDNGKTFANILATLDELGYDAEWQVLNSKYWVPQNRERIFIVGYLRGECRPEVFPISEICEEVNGESKDRQISTCIDSNYYKGADNHGQRQLIREGKLNVYNTDAQAGKIYNTKGISPTVSGQRINSQGWIKEPKLQQLNNPKHSTNRVYHENGLARTLKANTGAKTGLYKVGQSTKHNGTIVYDSKGNAPSLMAGEGSGSRIKIRSVLTPDRLNKRQNGRRIKDEGEPAFTLTAQDKHGVSDGENIRRLTPLECERLQGFPDNWTKVEVKQTSKIKKTFHVKKYLSDTQRYKCLGNAVTVPVVEFILSRFVFED